MKYWLPIIKIIVSLVLFSIIVLEKLLKPWEAFVIGLATGLLLINGLIELLAKQNGGGE